MKLLLLCLLRSLRYRLSRTFLLAAVLSMAASLASSLASISTTINRRVAEDVRKYGANLVIRPAAARFDVGSGGLGFGTITEPAYLSQREVKAALAPAGALIVDHSSHLRGELSSPRGTVAVEGVTFGEIRRLFPWWRIDGGWPARGEAVIGSGLASRLGVRTGDNLPLSPFTLRIAGVVTTGGEEDEILFVDLPLLQQALDLPDRVSEVRVTAAPSGDHLLRLEAEIRGRLPGATVSEVRQVARTSAALLYKVQLLMLLVTGVVVLAAGGSVAGTMGTAVFERGKEIGLMKALGGSRTQVVLFFVGESLVLGLFGGVGGFAAGCLLAEMTARTVFSTPAAIVPEALPAALAVSIGIAVVGSAGPLVRVFRLDPVQSLRGE